MNQRRSPRTRRTVVAGALVVVMIALSAAPVLADQPVDTNEAPSDDAEPDDDAPSDDAEPDDDAPSDDAEPDDDAPGSADVDEMVVAVGLPPVPPSNDDSPVVAVGLPPVPPSNDDSPVVAVGLPPVPPSNDDSPVVAVGLPPVPPSNDDSPVVAVGLPPVPGRAQQPDHTSHRQSRGPLPAPPEALADTVGAVLALIDDCL